MAKRKHPCDVFLSHRRQDAELAADIARVLQSYDLEVLTDADAAQGQRLEDALWEAMAESQALVAVVPDGVPSPWVLGELGAAQARNQPADGVLFGPLAALRATA